MIEVRQTDVFIDWLGRLRDTRAQAKIAGRIARLADGISAMQSPLATGSANCASISDRATGSIF